MGPVKKITESWKERRGVRSGLKESDPEERRKRRKETDPAKKIGGS